MDLICYCSNLANVGFYLLIGDKSHLFRHYEIWWECDTGAMDA